MHNLRGRTAKTSAPYYFRTNLGDFGVELVHTQAAEYGGAGQIRGRVSRERLSRPRITSISRQAVVLDGLGAEKRQEKKEIFARRQEIREMQEMPKEMATSNTLSSGRDSRAFFSYQNLWRYASQGDYRLLRWYRCVRDLRKG